MSDEVIILAEEDIKDVVILADESSFKALTLELAFNELLLAHVVRVNTDHGFVENYNCFSSEVEELLLEDEYDGAKLIIIPNEGVKAGKMYTVKPTDGTSDGVMDRNGEKTRVNKAGLIETMAANILLPDYTDGGCGVIKPEEQSTNSLRWSEKFDESVWGTLSTNITNVIGQDAPDGSLNAARITAINGAVTHRLRHDGATIISGLNYINTFYIKRVNGTGQIKFYDVGGFSHFITITNEWKRYDVNVLSTSTSGRFFLDIVDNGDSVDVWGGEIKLDDSSYIKTEGTAVTRLKDNTSFPVPAGVTEIIETIDNVEQTPITVIPVNYELPEANINKVIMN